MRAANALELLQAWELGLGQAPVRRALTLLACVSPQSSDEELWTLSIGQRDARLIEMRRRLFGPQAMLVGACPACHAQFESSLRLQDIYCEAPTAQATHTFEAGDYRLSFRVPNSLDLMALPADTSPEIAADALLERCITEACNVDGVPVRSAGVRAVVGESLAERMAQLDPQADVQLAASCASCGHCWSSVFDIASFLWQEVHVWAQRTLRDVHRLAVAYGWSESECLALSATRRQIYLELCRS